MTEPKYDGAAWRSRFLRAPKYSLQLAARPDFVPLATVADVKLGLKTGCDDFFFLEATKAEKKPLLLATPLKGVKNVQGSDGWRGGISSRDLRLAVKNPKQLFRDDGERGFLIHPVRATYYLAARDRSPHGDLAGYVAIAEAKGIDRLPLVRDNATGGRWFVQARRAVAYRWVLPYNSAYDYGAWDNHWGFVLNGRLVGVEPNADCPEELLGAVLNSTFAILTRLLEGTTTGTEAAFDVGPPAARRMRIPDPRRIAGPSVRAIEEVLAEMRSSDRLPSAPDESGGVTDLRRRLDLEVLQGLGCTRGDASVIAGRAYESYGRWRTAVRKVEEQMQAYRALMNRKGVSRNLDPATLAARRTWEDLQAELPLLPADLVSISDFREHVEIDRSFHPGPQEPMLQPGRVRLQSGEEKDLGNWPRVLYATMLLEIGFPNPIEVVEDTGLAQRVVNAFEQADRRLDELATERGAVYASGATLEAVVARVKKLWLAECRKSGMASDGADKSVRDSPSPQVGFGEEGSSSVGGAVSPPLE